MKTSSKQPVLQTVEVERRLSPIRVIMAVLLVLGLINTSIYGWHWWQESQKIATLKPWFAAYVDVTAKPTYAFEHMSTPAGKHVVLSFIVSSTTNACIPTWGTYYTLEEAGNILDLDRRIARLHQQEGKVAISFGGALNHELSLNCINTDELLLAYESVINRYQIDTIDLDLENDSLNNTQAGQRRAEVIAKLQDKRRSEGKSLAVWLTLPVAPQGLTQAGTSTISQMLLAGVDLAGVNVMTMNYSESKDQNDTMNTASQKALIQTHRQLGLLYKQAGISLNSKSLWRKIGATPMIGQNDVVAEVFTLEDATSLNAFARKQGVGRMSMWSANRDIPCSDNYVDTKVVSDSCSGVGETKARFTETLGSGFDGDLTQNAKLKTIEDTEVGIQKVDDPATSPYQIWQENGAYLAKTKVVWHGNVYEAKWWTKSDMPDNPVLQSWETPWQLIGPVLPGETPVPQPTLPPGTYPTWQGGVIYQAGNRVLFEGIPFQAKWWNQGGSPAAYAANVDSSPWAPLTLAEIKEILNKKTK